MKQHPVNWRQENAPWQLHSEDKVGNKAELQVPFSVVDELPQNQN